MKLSFATRVRWFVVLLACSFGLSVVATFQLLGQRQLARAADLDLESTSGLMASSIVARRNLLGSLSAYMARSPQLFGLAVANDAATVTEPLGEIREATHVDAMVLTNPEGKLLGHAGFKTPPRIADVHDLAQEGLRGQTSTGIVVVDGQLYIGAASPLYFGGRRLVGAVVVYQRLGREFAETIRGSQHVEMAVLQAGSPVLASFASSKEVLTSPRSNYVWLRGEEYASRRASMPGSRPQDRLDLVVLRPMERTLGTYRQLTQAFLAVLVAVSALGLIVGTAFAERTVTSLRTLLMSAKALKRGEWPEKVPVSGTDEIGTLQQTFNDMAESLKRSQDRLLAMIDSDPLTDLSNHRHFKERLEQEAARTTASGDPLMMLMIDIDDFAGLNAREGHSAGDLVLQRLAGAIRKAAPEFAILARFGGDRFAVLVPGGTVEEAQALFSRVKEQVGDVSIRGGSAELASAKGRADALVIAVELALTRAKELGPGQHCDFGEVPGASDSDPVSLSRVLSDGTYAAIRALAAAVDAKDTYTFGHSDRVAQYATELAAYVGEGAEVVDRIHRCGTLHDVGKIGVPDSILQKPGRLTEDEFRLMQAHAAMGEYIVSRVPMLADLLPGVRHHHERFDGKGYPDGLEGDAIPLIARFLAIADTYDAMTSDRPYRKGLDPEVALNEIEKGAGTQFDPELALAFCEMKRPLRKAA